MDEGSTPFRRANQLRVKRLCTATGLISRCRSVRFRHPLPTIPQPVDRVVVYEITIEGSTPSWGTNHPRQQSFRSTLLVWMLAHAATVEYCVQTFPGIAQFGRALALGARRREFKSLCPDQSMPMHRGKQTRIGLALSHTDTYGWSEQAKAK